MAFALLPIITQIPLVPITVDAQGINASLIERSPDERRGSDGETLLFQSKTLHFIVFKVHRLVRRLALR